MSSLKVCGVIAVVALACGCTTEPLVRSAVTSNLVQEEAHNKFLLLNIARAHQHMPMHFSQVTAVRASPGGFGIGVPSIGFEIPFGAGVGASTFSPSLESTSSVDTATLTSQEFYQGITTPVKPSLMTYFLSQGWPQAVVLFMFVHAIDFYDANENLIRNVRNGARKNHEFADIVRDLLDCRFVSSTETRFATEESEDTLKVLPRRPEKDATCSKEFPVSKAVRDAAANWPSAASAPRPATAIATSSKSVPATVRANQSAFSAPTPASVPAVPAGASAPVITAKITLRSPEAMVYYLGELSREQNKASAPQHDPWCCDPGRPKTLAEQAQCRQVPATLFWLRDATVSNPVVTVDYGKRTYWIGPHSEEDRSAHVLSLLTQVLALQNKGTEGPSTSNVRVVR